MSILNFALQILPSYVFNMLVIDLGYSLDKVEPNYEASSNYNFSF